MKKFQVAMICAALVMFAGIGTAFAQGLGAIDHPLPQCRVWVQDVPSQVVIEEGTVTCTVTGYYKGTVNTWVVEADYDGPGYYGITIPNFEPTAGSVFSTMVEVDIDYVDVAPAPGTSYYTAYGYDGSYYTSNPWKFDFTVNDWQVTYHDGYPSGK